MQLYEIREPNTASYSSVYALLSREGFSEMASDGRFIIKKYRHLTRDVKITFRRLVVEIDSKRAGTVSAKDITDIITIIGGQLFSLNGNGKSKLVDLATLK